MGNLEGMDHCTISRAGITAEELYLGCDGILSGDFSPLSFRFGHFPTPQQNQIQEPDLVHFSEIDLLSMSIEEGQNAGFFDVGNVPPISVASTCALEPVTEPSVRVQIGQIRLLADARAERD